VLVTTHYLDEAETLADRLKIMHAGRIVRSGTPTEIAAGHPSTISFASLPGVSHVPGDLAGVGRVVHEYGRTTMETDALQRSLPTKKEVSGDHDHRCRSLSRSDGREPDPLEHGAALAQPPRVRLRPGAAAAAARAAVHRRTRLRVRGCGAITTMS